MIVRENLSSVITSIGKNNYTPVNDLPMGIVFGVVTTENTPTKAAFEKAGGFSGIGKVFYLNYPISKNINTGSLNDNFYLNKCSIAKPQFSNQHYPLLKEIINLSSLASPATQDSDSTSGEYYTVLNLWNNIQQNAQLSNDNDNLGVTFTENPNIRPLIPYEGDNILGGRQGSSLRFTSTTRGVTPSNEWSEVGGEYDPITILTNGLDYDSNKKYYVEQINKDASSIYLTSLQKIPLQTDKTGVLNNLTNPLNVPDYIYAQTILNSDRVVLNSKKDEVMIFAKTNIELNTKNIINLNADERVHLNANAVFLGPYDSNNIPQPVLLGYDTIKVFEQLQETLTKLASYLSSAVSTPEGSPIISLNNAGNELLSDMKKVCDLLENTTSKKVFTS
jgi:hypothetical protein